MDLCIKYATWFITPRDGFSIFSPPSRFINFFTMNDGKWPLYASKGDIMGSITVSNNQVFVVGHWKIVRQFFPRRISVICLIFLPTTRASNFMKNGRNLTGCDNIWTRREMYVPRGTLTWRNVKSNVLFSNRWRGEVKHIFEYQELFICFLQTNWIDLTVSLQSWSQKTSTNVTKFVPATLLGY